MIVKEKERGERRVGGEGGGKNDANKDTENVCTWICVCTFFCLKYGLRMFIGGDIVN